MDKHLLEQFSDDAEVMTQLRSTLMTELKLRELECKNRVFEVQRQINLWRQGIVPDGNQ